MGGSQEREGGLRRRMPLRKVGTSGGGVGGAAAGIGGRAMRYYRLWIYTCNAALLAGAIVFMGAATRTVLLDYRRALIPALALYQPSFLYALLAVLTQGGAIQLLGCLAAMRLSEKLLNIYWILLMVLLFGDIVIGAFWTFKFDRLCKELTPTLRIRFQHDYATNPDMTALWDRLQSEESCCGVMGPEEFEQSNATSLPPSCCIEPPDVNTTKCKPFQTGCEERLRSYVQSTASLLAILGYCVLAFLKMCFLGILRYEIKEMIQKIRLLEAEMQLTLANGSVPGGMRLEGTECERESLLVHPDCEQTNFLSSPPQNKNPNGNNNYEMREYRPPRQRDNI